MWRDDEFADGRKKDEDGLIKCYSGLLWYSHYLPHRSGCAVMACSPHMNAKLFPFPLPAFLHLLLTNWNNDINWMEKHSCQNYSILPPNLLGQMSKQLLLGAREGSQDAGLVRTQAVTTNHQLAGKLTTNT